MRPFCLATGCLAATAGLAVAVQQPATRGRGISSEGAAPSTADNDPAGCAPLPDGTGLNVTWPPTVGAVLYEVQVAAGGAAAEANGGLVWQVSVTSAAAAVQLVDLVPSTTYALKVRSTHFNEVSGWTAWQPQFNCSTAPAAHRSDASVAMKAAGVEASPPSSPPAAQVRVVPPAAHAQQSSCEGCQFVSVVRVSERNNTEPDFLSNHDCGDPAGDALFLTATGGAGGKFIPEWNISAITQYCVEVAAPGPVADYLSCNAPSTGPNLTTAQRQQQMTPNATQICECNNAFDRRVGHQNMTAACGTGALPWSLCNCSADSTALSAKYVGHMQTYLPWVCGEANTGDGTCDVSLPFGNWYSMPAATQCAEGAPVGTDGCTWRRLPTAHVLRGWQLLDAGWNGTEPAWDKSEQTMQQYRHNAAVLESSFQAITPRACGRA